MFHEVKIKPYLMLFYKYVHESKSWKYKFIHCLPPIFAQNKDFSKNYLSYKENYPQFKINLWLEKVNFYCSTNPDLKTKRGVKKT